MYKHVHMCGVWIMFEEYENTYKYTNLFWYKLSLTDKHSIKLKINAKILLPK